MSIKNGSWIYEYPELYELLYPSDRSAEVFFLDGLFQKVGLSLGDRLLEVASGFGSTALQLSYLGWKVSALDLSPAMLEALKKRLVEAEVEMNLIQADMRNFQSQESYQGGFCSLGSIGLLPDFKAIELHLQTMAKHMTPEGIYVIDVGLNEDKSQLFDYGEVDWFMENDRYELHAHEGKIEVYDHIHKEASTLQWGQAPWVFKPQDFEEMIHRSNAFDLLAAYPQIEQDEYGAALFDLDTSDAKPQGERAMVVLKKKN